MQDGRLEETMKEEGDGEGRNEISAEETDDPTQVTHSLFPAPPAAFARFTRHHVARYRVLKNAKETDENTPGGFDWTTADPADRIARQREILQRAAADVTDDTTMQDNDGSEGEGASKSDPPALLPAPEWDVLLAMEPARVDWIEEEGYFSCFGEQWPVKETLPPLEAMGMTQIYPSSQEDSDAINRAEILTTLLRTMLKSYLGLVDVLLSAPKEYLANEHDPGTGQLLSQQWRFTSQDKAREINDLSINFMHLLNESRPLQARERLRDMMQRQLDRRREEAALMKSQCSAMRREIASIRERLQKDASDVAESM